jgi:branched-chain amino acid transport system permease protein
MIELYLQGIISGILLGGVYALIAIGLTLIFGVLKIINFAHGEFLMLGLYLTFITCFAFDISPYLSVPIIFVCMFVVGSGIYYFIIRLVIKADEINQILLTMGIAWVMQNAAVIIFSSNVYRVQSSIRLLSFDIFGIIVDCSRLIAFLASLLCALLVYLFLHKTKTGRIVRASADNREAAIRMGVNVNRIFMLTFGLGISLLGIGAPLLSTFYQITPYVGITFTLTAFIIVVLGTLGSFKGAIVGGIIIGISESLGSILFPGTWGAIAPYLIFLAALLFKPEGLFPLKGL